MSPEITSISIFFVDLFTSILMCVYFSRTVQSLLATFMKVNESEVIWRFIFLMTLSGIKLRVNSASIKTFVSLYQAGLPV